MDASNETLLRARQVFQEVVTAAGLLDEGVAVFARPLTPEEAIGTPGRRDFPIVLGRERVIEAQVRGARGHAFTDSAREILGTLREVLALPLDRSSDRAILVATMNATLRYLRRTNGTVHCRNDEPELCAEEIADTLAEEVPEGRIGLVGLNPAIAEALVARFGPERLRISDLNPESIGGRRGGVAVLDGNRYDDLVRDVDLVLMTGTTLVNGTLDPLLESVRRHGRRHLLYGVTIAGAATLLELPRICPCGHDA